MTTDQLDAEHLHEVARDPERVPLAFANANLTVDQTERAYRDAVRDRHELIRAARAVGVPWVALARWTGFNVKTLSEIVRAGTQDEPKP